MPKILPSLLLLVMAVYTVRALLESSFGRYARWGAVFDYVLIAGLSGILLWD